MNSSATMWRWMGLSLDIFENEFLCIVGPSGCGKSTLIAAIAGFLKPRAGRLEMNGRPIGRPRADRGVVFQEYALLPWKNVIDNVALGLKFKGIGKAERHAIARKFLAMTGPHGRGGQIPARALGRHEAARGGRAHARQLARGDADGRALRGGRRADADDPAGGTGAHLGAVARHRHLRHPQR